jgi:hypothetical protein
MSRRCRKYLRQVQKAKSKYELQQIASYIQGDLDRRNISYDEALNVGNVLQDKADTMPNNDIVYAISDRDSYRRTLELYLKDGILTVTEQLLLWEERRRLGITDDDHERLMQQLLAQWQKQGKSVTIHHFRRGGATDA